MNIYLLLFLFLGILLFFFLTGFPVGFALALTTIVLMLLGIGTGLNTPVLISRMFRGLNSFVLLSIPFFLLAGRVMNAGGMTVRIFRFARSLMGSLKGGMGHVNILASMIFAGMSGVAVADAAGLGAIEYEAMKSDGYPDDFSVGVSGASAIVGPIIPPSLPLVIYAILAGTSVGGVLIAGIIPGIVTGIMLMIMVAFISIKRDFPTGPKLTWKEFSKSFKEGYLALGTPLILFGGIVSGFFTITEAAAIAVFYALILGLFVYRELTLPDLWEMIKQTMIDSATILFLVSCSFAYGYLAIHARIPIVLAEAVMSITENPILILLMMNVFFLIIGLFMDSTPSITILTPVLIPLVNTVGIHPIHFGLVMVFNLMIGLLTPPFGQVLFVLTKSTGVSFETVVRGVLPFYAPLLITLLIITLFPQVTLFLPQLVGWGI
jgi:tripartite ATP-independent transporter DctM subunit